MQVSLYIYSYCPYPLSVQLKGTRWTGRMDRGMTVWMTDRADSGEASFLILTHGHAILRKLGVEGFMKEEAPTARELVSAIATAPLMQCECVRVHAGAGWPLNRAPAAGWAILSVRLKGRLHSSFNIY